MNVLTRFCNVQFAHYVIPLNVVKNLAFIVSFNNIVHFGIYLMKNIKQFPMQTTVGYVHNNTRILHISTLSFSGIEHVYKIAHCDVGQVRDKTWPEVTYRASPPIKKFLNRIQNFAKCESRDRDERWFDNV